MHYEYFSIKELNTYISYILKSKKRFNKNDNEVLAALTVLIAYHSEYKPANYFFGFPLKNNLSEKEIKSLPHDFTKISKYIEDDSLEDVRIIIKEKSGDTFVLPLQMKRIDMKNIDSTLKMINFLEKLKIYSKSKTRLIMIYEDIITPLSREGGKYKISLVELEKWFRENDFPFQEIILACLKKEKKRKITFYQFWPLMKTPCGEKKFTMNDITTFTKNNSNI